MSEERSAQGRVRLGDVCDLYQPKTVARKDFIEGGPFPVFGANGEIGRLDRFNHADAEVLLSCRGNCGTVNISRPKSWINGNAMVCHPKDESLDKDFLAHQLSSIDWTPVISGTAQQQITRGPLSEVRIWVPPLDEQRRIVATLEDHLSRLDAAMVSISAVDRLSALLKDAQRRLLLYPEGASTVPISTVASVVNGSTPKGIAEVTVAEGAPGRVPYIKVGDMNSGDGVHVMTSRTWVTEEDAQRLGLRVTPPGTVIFPKRGGAIATNKKRVLGRPAAFDLNTMGVVPGPDLNPAFLRMYFESVDLSSIADGSNIPQINAKGMAQLRVPLLDLEAQREAVALLETIEGVVLRAVTSPLRDRANQLRTSLLQAAFTGQLTKELSVV